MPQSVQQFIASIPTEDDILRRLDDLRAERELLREVLKLARKSPIPHSQRRHVPETAESCVA